MITSEDIASKTRLQVKYGIHILLARSISRDNKEVDYI